MKTEHMVEVIAPGLPSWPRLLFDPVARCAVVSARYPTWRSYQWAFWLAKAATFLACGLLAAVVWQLVPPWDDVVLRFMVFLFATLFVSGLATKCLRGTLPDFFARRVFAARTVCWFSPSQIIFRSPLYARPVIIWRHWNGRSVKVRFLLSEDLEAQAQTERTQMDMKRPRQHLRDARLLEVLLSTVHNRPDVDINGHDSALRAIPITEISGHEGTKFTVVYGSAVLLTDQGHSPRETASPEGIDIDAH